MLRALHDGHAEALWRYAVRLTGDEQLAEDVVQEALLRVHQRGPDVANDEEPNPRDSGKRVAGDRDLFEAAGAIGPDASENTDESRCPQIEPIDDAERQGAEL